MFSSLRVHVRLHSRATLLSLVPSFRRRFCRLSNGRAGHVPHRSLVTNPLRVKLEVWESKLSLAYGRGWIVFFHHFRWCCSFHVWFRHLSELCAASFAEKDMLLQTYQKFYSIKFRVPIAKVTKVLAPPPSLYTTICIFRRFLICFLIWGAAHEYDIHFLKFQRLR